MDIYIDSFGPGDDGITRWGIDGKTPGILVVKVGVGFVTFRTRRAVQRQSPRTGRPSRFRLVVR